MNPEFLNFWNTPLHVPEATTKHNPASDPGPLPLGWCAGGSLSQYNKMSGKPLRLVSKRCRFKAAAIGPLHFSEICSASSDMEQQAAGNSSNCDSMREFEHQHLTN